MNFTAILLVCGLMTIITLVFNSGEFKSNRNKKREERITAANERNKIYEDGIIKYGLDDNVKLEVYDKEYKLVLNGNNELFHLSYWFNKKVSKINLEDILDVKFNISVKEQNKMKVVSLVPTFNKKTKFEYAVFEILTVDEDYCVQIDNNTYNSVKISQMLKDMERMKLLIEREMKNLNKSNN